MRRLLLIFLAFSAAGAFTVSASRFTADVEDNASYFETDVSISVPDTTPCTPTNIPSPVYIRTVGGVRVLDPTPPTPSVPPNDNFETSNGLQFATTPVESNTDSNSFLTWGVPVFPAQPPQPAQPPSCGYSLTGQVWLYIQTSFNPGVSVNLGNVTLTVEAGLFSCGPNAPETTTTGCTKIAGGSVPLVTDNNVLVQIDMGTLNNAVVPGVNQLRLKTQFRLQGGLNLQGPALPRFRWGYTPNYQAGLTVGS
jgi:hypothetical protein